MTFEKQKEPKFSISDMQKPTKLKLQGEKVRNLKNNEGVQLATRRWYS